MPLFLGFLFYPGWLRPLFPGHLALKLALFFQIVSDFELRPRDSLRSASDFRESPAIGFELALFFRRPHPIKISINPLNICI